MTGISSRTALVASLVLLTACGPAAEPGDGGSAQAPVARGSGAQFALDDSSISLKVDETGRAFVVRKERGEQSRPQGSLQLKAREGSVVAALTLIEDGFLHGPVTAPLKGGSTGEQLHLLRPAAGLPSALLDHRGNINVSGAFKNGFRHGRWEWVVEHTDTAHPSAVISRAAEHHDEHGRVVESAIWLADGTRIEHKLVADNCETIGKFSQAMRRWKTLKPLVERNLLDLDERVPVLPNGATGCGETATHYSYPLLMVPAVDMRPMIEAGADPDVVSSDGRSAVLACVEQLSRGCGEDHLLWLIERATAVDVLRHQHGTPLTKLVENGRQYPETSLRAVKALLAKGADPNRFVYGKSALYWAAFKGQVGHAEMLVEHPATDLSLGSIDGDFALAPLLGISGFRDEKDVQLRKAALIDRFVERGGKLPDRRPDGTPLWAAVQSNDREGFVAVIAALKRHGVDFEARNQDDRNYEEEMLAKGQSWALDGLSSNAP